MARLAVTVTVLFFLFAFSHARTPLLFPENTVNHRDLTKSESDPTFLLPSEKQKSDFVIDPQESNSEIADTKSIAIETQSSNSGADLPESVTETVDSVPVTKPLTIVRFRPVNRHFRDGRPYPFRFGHHNCRHHRRDEQLNRPIHGGEIPYGNDMILSTESNGFGDDMIKGGGGGVRQIPARWIGFHHRHNNKGLPRFSYGHDDVFFSKHNYKKRPFHYDQDEKRGGGFMNRIRKFLNQF